MIWTFELACTFSLLSSVLCYSSIFDLPALDNIIPSRIPYNDSDPCNTSPLMSKWQKDQCVKNDVLQLGVSQGGWQVQNYCLENVKDGWRCLDLGHVSPFTLWIKDASKRAAFVTSLRAAFYVIHLQKACRHMGHPFCKCRFRGLPLRESGRRYRWRWQECAEGLKQALNWTEEWMNHDSYLTKNPNLRPTAEHNAKIGRELAISMLETGYRCKGEYYDDLKCYWGEAYLIVPEMEEVAEKLYSMSQVAKEVIWKYGPGSSFSQIKNGSMKTDLVYSLDNMF